MTQKSLHVVGLDSLLALARVGFTAACNILLHGLTDHFPGSLRLVLEQNPLAPSWHTPVYSNNGFMLFGLALENITGESFEDLFKASLVGPLNLTRTFLEVPEPANDPNAVLFEAQGGTWLKDLGVIDP